MQSPLLATIALTGFTVAFFHAAIPTHWLPFVLVARARRWSTRRALSVAALASLGHVVLTSLLGLLIAWFGFRLESSFAQWFSWIAGGALLCIAAYYFIRQARGLGVCHHRVTGGSHQPNRDCGHEHVHEPSHWEAELEGSNLVSERSGDGAAVGGLFLLLTLSPCEAFLPIYLSGVQFGWLGFWILSGILAAATFLAMLLFIWLSLVGLDRLGVRSFERYEAALLGSVFTVLAVIIVLLEH
jgi:nickel/cobalt exporter